MNNKASVPKKRSRPLIIVLIGVVLIFAFAWFAGIFGNKLQFSEVLDQYGFSMKHSKYDTLSICSPINSMLPATVESGVLNGTCFNHKITMSWYTTAFEMNDQDAMQEVLREAQRCSSNYRNSEIDTKLVENETRYDMHYYLLDGHKAHTLEWEGKDKDRTVYGMNMLWYCNQTKRVFKIEVEAWGYSPTIPMGAYAESFSCHLDNSQK